MTWYNYDYILYYNYIFIKTINMDHRRKTTINLTKSKSDFIIFTKKNNIINKLISSFSRKIK